MTNLCITTVVDKRYMEYAPLFCYCCKEVYPAFKVKLIMRDSCPYELPGASTATVFRDFPDHPYLSIALRFVVPPEIYQEFDFVYITDIDMMLMGERVPLDRFHMGEMVATGLCYSNSLRNTHHYAGYQSLSGLHFATKRWFIETEKRRQFYYEYLKAGVLGLYREYDGVMLYRMARDSGLGLPKKFKLKKRHHGIHLGNFRLFDTKEQWAARIPVEYRSQWLQYQSDPMFSEMVKYGRRHNEELSKQLDLLDDFIRNPK